MSCPPPGREGEGKGTEPGLLPPGVRVRVSRFTAHNIRNGIAPAEGLSIPHKSNFTLLFFSFMAPCSSTLSAPTSWLGSWLD